MRMPFILNVEHNMSSKVFAKMRKKLRLWKRQDRSRPFTIVLLAVKIFLLKYISNFTLHGYIVATKKDNYMKLY